MFGFGQSKRITEKLYEQNLELAVKNKTLLLLENLYQASVLALAPEDMAGKITDIIRKDLNFEFASVLIYQKETDSLAFLAFSASERLFKVLDGLGIVLKSAIIANVSKNTFFRKTVYDKVENSTNDFQEIIDNPQSKQRLAQIKKESHVKTALLYPLVKGQEVSGALLLGLNRDYSTLNTFEKASIKSCINAIALLLDKAYLYKDLQASYEIEKQAHEIEKKAKEELEKIDKFKDQFLMTTQHNLRTPLTSMMGYADLLLKGVFGKQTKKTTEVIVKFQNLTQGMIKMVNDFLDMAQFQLGKNVVSLKPGVDVLQMLDEIKNELEFKASSKGVYLKLEKPEGTLLIKADQQKLKAAIFNVIDNAVKYTVTGGVDVKIKNQDPIKIVVTDTGIGIPKEKIANLFNSMFERLDAAKKVSAVGSGIGLYLSGQIIKSHNGKVWVESNGEGKGSTFYIELPLG